MRISVLALLLILSGSAHAASLVQCLESALLDLQNQPLLEQTSPTLMQRGLIPSDSPSMLCGPTCGSYLMESIRQALQIPSAYHSMAAEIESLTKVEFFLGNDVTRNGMNLFQLRAAVLGDIAQHGITAEAEVKSLRMEGPPLIKTVSEIKIRDLEPDPTKAEISIIAADLIESPQGGHYFLVQKLDPQRKLIGLIDPMRPRAPRIVPYIEKPRADGKTDLQLGNPPMISVHGVLKIHVQLPPVSAQSGS